MNETGDILVTGMGGHARSCIDVLERAGWRIVGLIGLAEEAGLEVLGYKALGTEEDLARLRQAAPAALVGVGQIESPAVRMRQFERLSALGFRLPAIVSPLACVSRHASIGEGSIVMHGAIVNAGASVGRNCIVNSRALVEHDVMVGDHCHLSTASVLNGGARIGQGSFLGSGALVRHAVRIGEHCFIGMGGIVRKDCADGSRLPRGTEEQPG